MPTSMFSCLQKEEEYLIYTNLMKPPGFNPQYANPVYRHLAPVEWERTYSVTLNAIYGKV